MRFLTQVQSRTGEDFSMLYESMSAFISQTSSHVSLRAFKMLRIKRNFRAVIIFPVLPL